MRDLPRIYDHLRPLLDLEDNWDGHLSKSPSSEYVNFAAALLLQLPYAACLPQVMASTDGGVIIEWSHIMVIVSEQIEIWSKVGETEHCLLKGQFDYLQPSHIAELLSQELVH